MKTKKKLLRLGALLMAVLLSMASPVSAYATNNTGIVPGGDTAGDGTAVENTRENAPDAGTVTAEEVKSTIDRERLGSLTIYKYDKKIREDMAKSAGNGEGSGSAGDAGTGEGITNAIIAGTENGTLGGYGVEGVKFTCVKISDLTEQQTRTVKTVSGNEISTGVVTVFEADEALKGILWPTAEGVQPPTGVSLGGNRVGYTTTQLNAALERMYGAGDGMTGVPTGVKNALETYIKAKAGQGSTPGTGTGNNGSAVVLETDKNGMTKAENLPLGLYLVVETEVPRNVTSTVNPFFVSIPMTNEAGNDWEYDVTVYPKNQLETDEDKPTLKKTVKKAVTDSTVSDGNAAQGYGDALDVSFGDELEYRIVCRLPVITSEATYLTEFLIKDEVTGGLKYKGGSFQIDFYEKEEDAKAGTKEGEGKPLTTWKQAAENANCFTVTDITKENLTTGYSAGKIIAVSDDGLDVLNKGVSGENGGANYSGKYMAVTYRAEFSPEGAILGEAGDLEGAGNRNHAILYWKRTGGGEDPSDPTPPGPEDESIVFTYGLQLDKVFYRGDDQVSGNDTIAAGLGNDGVKFRLEKEGKGYIKAVEAAAETVLGDTAGDTSGEQAGNAAVSKVYNVTGYTTNEADATLFSPGRDGKLLLRGLSAGTYTLKETETLSDYALLVNDVKMIITATEAEYADRTDSGTGTDSGMIADSGTGTNPAMETAPVSGTGGKIWKITKHATATVTGLGNAEAEVAMESYVVNGLTSMNALVKLEIVNKALPFLANTGGIGILPFLFGGGALILVSVLLLWRRKKRSISKSAAAGMMAVVVLAGALGTAVSFDAEAVDLGQKCRLTIETRTNTESDQGSDRYSGILDVERPELAVDLYKIAAAVPVPEDMAGSGTAESSLRYDMYTLKLTEEFAALQGSQAAADKVTQADLNAILYADSDTQVRQEYLKLANKATKAVLGITAEDGKVMDSGKAGMTPLSTKTVNGTNGAGVFAGLAPGLYLAIPHGAALENPEDYTVVLTGSEDPELELTGGNLATVAYGKEYIYRYMPELVALPQRELTTGGNTGSSDAWQYEVTATLKAEAASQYASLQIVKNRTFGTEEGAPRNPGLTGEDTFVYRVEATLGGKSVYSNVVKLTMPADQNTAERTLRLIVPVGAKITVTEDYTGASHDLPENVEAVQEIPSAVADKTTDGKTEPGNTVTFTNKYNGTGTGGGAVENQFTYGDKADGGQGWEWNPEPEGIEKPGSGSQGEGSTASGSQEAGNAQGSGSQEAGNAQGSGSQEAGNAQGSGSQEAGNQGTGGTQGPEAQAQ